ncbi:S-fimbrial adhesin protein SfaS precursor [compost metagenome]
MHSINRLLHTVLWCLPLLLGVSSSFAQATDTVISVSAVIKESSCKVAASSIEQSVDLGKGRVADLKQANAATEWKPFSVELTDCPDSVTQVVATVSGTPDKDRAEDFLNTGTAKKVAVEVKNAADDAQISNGKTVTTTVDQAHNAALQFKGRMITPTGGATSGSVAALMEFSFEFK